MAEGVNKGGRPTDYNEEVATKICELIADGNSVRTICAMEGMPSRASIILWLTKHEEFSVQYARACAVRQEEKFDEIRDIAANTEDVQRARLLVDVVKWQLSKEAPKKYGDKLDMTSGGEKLEGLVIVRDKSEVSEQ